MNMTNTINATSHTCPFLDGWVPCVPRQYRGVSSPRPVFVWSNASTFAQAVFVLAYHAMPRRGAVDIDGNVRRDCSAERAWQYFRSFRNLTCVDHIIDSIHKMDRTGVEPASTGRSVACPVALPASATGPKPLERKGIEPQQSFTQAVTHLFHNI
jgi:hypothetical protein